MRISDWSSDVCSSDLYYYVGNGAEAPDGAFSLNLVYDRAEEAGRLYGAVHDGLWYHISTPADLDAANRRFAQGHMPDTPYFRTEERRAGQECVSTCRSRWSPSH